MCDAFELFSDSVIDGGDAVSVDVAPERGDAVEVAVALIVDEIKTLSPIDDQRGRLPPLPHRSEGVPDMGVVQRVGRSMFGGRQGHQSRVSISVVSVSGIKCRHQTGRFEQMQDSDASTRPPIDVHARELHAQLLRGDTVLIDVREPFEHSAERIESAVPMPLGQLDAQALRELYPDKQIIFHCAGGKRSAKACSSFSAGQSEAAKHLAGGIEAWKQAGLPTLKPAKGCRIPVMRQVQIAAGSLVVVGVVLGVWVSPWFNALSAFVGCGLVFAGLTGWCGMAKALAILPWNKTR